MQCSYPGRCLLVYPLITNRNCTSYLAYDRNAAVEVYLEGSGRRCSLFRASDGVECASSSTRSSSEMRLFALFGTSVLCSYRTPESSVNRNQSAPSEERVRSCLAQRTSSKVSLYQKRISAVAIQIFLCLLSQHIPFSVPVCILF